MGSPYIYCTRISFSFLSIVVTWVNQKFRHPSSWWPKLGWTWTSGWLRFRCFSSSVPKRPLWAQFDCNPSFKTNIYAKSSNHGLYMYNIISGSFDSKLLNPPPLPCHSLCKDIGLKRKYQDKLNENSRQFDYVLQSSIFASLTKTLICIGKLERIRQLWNEPEIIVLHCKI